MRIKQQGEPSLVTPAEETPGGLYYLSNLDQNIAVIVQTVYCFRAADGGAGGGVSACDVLVEADADCAMADIGDVTEPDPSVLGRLVYSVPGAKNILEMPLLAAQVRTICCSCIDLLDRWS
jgi:omega-hydroxypalmitate O-feruloyl transferase